MSEINFHRLNAADRIEYNHYYRKSQSRLADLAFNCRVAWDEVFKSEMAVY